MVPNVQDEFGAIAVIIATIILFIQNHIQTKKTKQLDTSLHKTNGGSSVRDALNEIKERLKRIEAQADFSQEEAARRDAKIDAVDKKINDHIIEGKKK